jgi:hypothetical protein
MARTNSKASNFLDKTAMAAVKRQARDVLREALEDRIVEEAAELGHQWVTANRATIKAEVEKTLTAEIPKLINRLRLRVEADW